MKKGVRRMAGLLLAFLLTFSNAAFVLGTEAGGNAEAAENGDTEGRVEEPEAGVESEGSALFVITEGVETDKETPGESVGSAIHDDGGEMRALDDVEALEGPPSSPVVSGAEGPLNEEEPSANGEDINNLQPLMNDDGTVHPDSYYISVNITPVQLYSVGSIMTITLTFHGAYNGCYASYANTNPTAYSCTWGNWSGNSIPMRIQANARGSGKIYIYLKSPNGTTLAGGYIPVYILSPSPSVTVSSNSLSVPEGGVRSLNVTVHNYSGSGTVYYSIGNNSVCSAQWGNWSGWTVPLNVTGKAAGSARITITFRDSDNVERASTSFTVSVYSSASISLSSTSVTMRSGYSVNLRVTLSGTIYRGDTIESVYTNSNAVNCTWSNYWSGQSTNLTITGKNSGSGTITIYWKNSAGGVRAQSSSISFTVTGNPAVSASPSSASVDTGGAAFVNCSVSGFSGEYTLRRTNNNPSNFNLEFDSWVNSSTARYKITGQSAGSGSFTVSLLLNGSVRDTVTVRVTVQSARVYPSYSFPNYSVSGGISLDRYQYIFGDNQRARDLWKANPDIGEGVCFGISSTAGLLLSPNTPNPSSYRSSASKASQLKKNDYSSFYGMPVNKFIEAMHISQLASSMVEYGGLSNLIGAVRNGGANNPVIICVYGPYNGGAAGHALLAYGVTQSGSNYNVLLYDPNYPGEERTLAIAGNRWSYKMWDGLIWNSENGSISYIPYSTYSRIWSNHGSVDMSGLLNLTEEDNLMLITQSDDFTLTDIQGNLLAKYDNGVLVEHAENVREVLWSDLLPDGSVVDHPNILFLDQNSYRVRNEGDSMTMTLSGLDVSVCVTTSAESFEIGVQESNDTAYAVVHAEEGEPYSIVLASSDPEDLDETVVEGTGNGQTISLGVNSAGTYVSNGSPNESTSTLSLNDLEVTGSGNIEQDFNLTAKNRDARFSIEAEASKGGRISSEGITTVDGGESALYRMWPEEGYRLKSLYVNDKKAVYASENLEEDAPTYCYYDGAYEILFQNVWENKTLYAEFAREIDACDISLRTENEGQLYPVLKDPDSGEELLENIDYSVSRGEEDGQTVFFITAVEDSGYCGVTTVSYEDMGSENRLENAAYDKISNEIRVNVIHTGYASLIAEAYEKNDKVLHIFAAEETANENGDEVMVIHLNADMSNASTIKLFLLRDMKNMQPLCEPVSIPVDNT